MANAPVDVIVAGFADEQGASDALSDLKMARDADMIKIKDAAVLRKEMDGKLHVHEAIDKGMGKGAVLGGIAGAVVGLIAGPVGWLTLGGAAVGGLAMRLRESGFTDRRLHDIGERIQPGSSALIAVVEEEWVREVERRLRDAAADLVTEEIATDVADQLEAEGERLQVDRAA
jgi:uncharacterized membrane protein